MRSTCQGDIYESFVKESTDEGLCIGLNAEVGVHQLGATAIQALVRGSVQAALGASNAVVAAAVKDAPPSRCWQQYQPPRHAALGATGELV
jgi:hypothetical protein